MQWGALKTAVSAWANRNDLTAQIGTFLLLAEERIYSGDPANNIEPLRCARCRRADHASRLPGVAAPA